MRLLITGAGGFIGRHAVRIAADQGHDVIPWMRRMGWFDEPAARATLETVDAVIHLAGLYPVRGEDTASTLELFQSNAVLTATLIAACEHAEVSRVVLSSTANVYHPTTNVWHSESSATPGRTAYAASKLSAEALVRYHGGVSLRLFNVYGPGQDSRNVLGTIAKQAIGGGIVRILDDRPERDFVHVVDVARAFVAAASRPGRLPDAINIGSGQRTSIRELVRLVSDATGYNGRVVAENRHDAVVDSIVADNTLARNVLDWTPEVGLVQGVLDTVSDLRSRLASGED